MALSCYLTITTYSCIIWSMTSNTKQRITLFINPAIAKHAKAQAILEDLSLTALVEKALISYLPKETVIKKAYIRVDFDPRTKRNEGGELKNNNVIK